MTARNLVSLCVMLVSVSLPDGSDGVTSCGVLAAPAAGHVDARGLQPATKLTRRRSRVALIFSVRYPCSASASKPSRVMAAHGTARQDLSPWRQPSAPGVHRLYVTEILKGSAIPAELANCQLSENDWMEMRAVVKKEHQASGKFGCYCCLWVCLLFPTLFTPLVLGGIGGRKVFYQDQYPPLPTGCQITSECNYDCWSKNSNSPAIDNLFGDGKCFELCNTQACCFDGCDCTTSEPGCVAPPPSPPSSPPMMLPPPPSPPPPAPSPPEKDFVRTSRPRYVSGTQPFATWQTVGYIAPLLVILASLMLCKGAMNAMRRGAVLRSAEQVAGLWSAKPLTVLAGHHYYASRSRKGRTSINLACYLDFAPEHPVAMAVAMQTEVSVVNAVATPLAEPIVVQVVSDPGSH